MRYSIIFLFIFERRTLKWNLTLGNWKAGKKDREGVAKIQSGPAVIPPSIDANRYRNMIDDVFKVIDKYHVEKKGEK